MVAKGIEGRSEVIGESKKSLYCPKCGFVTPHIRCKVADLQEGTISTFDKCRECGDASYNRPSENPYIYRPDPDHVEEIADQLLEEEPKKRVVSKYKPSRHSQ